MNYEKIIRELSFDVIGNKNNLISIRSRFNLGSPERDLINELLLNTLFNYREEKRIPIKEIFEEIDEEYGDDGVKEGVIDWSDVIYEALCRVAEKKMVNDSVKFDSYYDDYYRKNFLTRPDKFFLTAEGERYFAVGDELEDFEERVGYDSYILSEIEFRRIEERQSGEDFSVTEMLEQQLDYDSAIYSIADITGVDEEYLRDILEDYIDSEMYFKVDVEVKGYE